MLKSQEAWGKRPIAPTRQLFEFLDKCIQELRRSYRRAYVLKDVEKLSEDQVCEILGISKSAMKTGSTSPG